MLLYDIDTKQALYHWNRPLAQRSAKSEALHWTAILSIHQAATCVVMTLGACKGAQCHEHLVAKTTQGGSPLGGQHQTRCEEQERETLH